MRQRAIVSSSERLQETQLQGQAFCRTTSDIWGGDLKDLTYPVAVGGIARRMEIDASLTSAIYLQASHYDLDIVLIESGGDNQSASFSPELADLTLYVIDVAAGEEIPRKGGPAITKSDLLVINKTDLAPHVGASLEVMQHDCLKMRGQRPYVFCSLRHNEGVPEVLDYIVEAGGLRFSAA